MAGRSIEGIFMSSVSFFTFFVVSSGIVGLCVCACCRLGMGSLSSPKIGNGCVGKRNEPEGAMDVADSGEEDAEVSETNGESKVELVVVGEDSVEAEKREFRLPRCW